MTEFHGRLSANDGRFAIVASRFNSLFTDQLLAGCKDALTRHGIEAAAIDVAWVPGAIELPLVAKRFATSGNYSAIVVLGCVIRGATSHYDHVCDVATKGSAQVSLDTGVPVILGVLTCENLEQAMERSGTKAGNKGFDAGMAALEMASLLGQLP